MKTLHLCNRVPYPPHDGGAIGIYDLIGNLAAQGVAVTVLAINTPKHYQPDEVLRDRARLVTVFVDTNLSVVKAFFNLFTAVPYVFARFVAPAYTRKLIQLLQTETFDVVQVEGSPMAWYVPTVRQYTAAPVVLRAHNVEYTIWQRLARHEKNVFRKIYFHYTAARVKQFEQVYFKQFDAVAAITPPDQDRIRALGVSVRVAVIPAGVEMSRFTANVGRQPQPKSIFTIGSLNWRPNQAGLHWFLQDVWPVISRECPELEWHLAGAAPPAEWLNLKLPRVTVHGYVPDAAAFMQRYELMLVPLRAGGGLRIKIIEGMSLGKCILTTSVGAEGISGVAAYGNILLADSAAEWLHMLRQYCQGRLPINQIGRNAAQLIRQQYDNRLVIPQYRALYEELLAARKG